MGTTTHDLPYPDPTDAPDAPAQVQALAEAVDDLVSDPERVRVFRSTNQSVTSGGGGTAISWDSETYDHGGLHSGGAPTKLVVVEPGAYEVDARASYAANATGFRALHIQVNGFTVATHYVAASSGTVSVSVAVGDTIDLLGGDEVTVLAEQTSGGALNVMAGSALTYLRARRVSG